jgi:hypothetical protein
MLFIQLSGGSFQACHRWLRDWRKTSATSEDLVMATLFPSPEDALIFRQLRAEITRKIVLGDANGFEFVVDARLREVGILVIVDALVDSGWFVDGNEHEQGKVMYTCTRPEK